MVCCGYLSAEAPKYRWTKFEAIFRQAADSWAVSFMGYLSANRRNIRLRNWGYLSAATDRSFRLRDTVYPARGAFLSLMKNRSRTDIFWKFCRILTLKWLRAAWYAAFHAEHPRSSWIYHRIMSLLIMFSKMRRFESLQNWMSFQKS